jgi:hypothetical protein
MVSINEDFVGSAGAVSSTIWNPINNPTVGTGGGFTRDGAGKGLLRSSNAGGYNANAFIRAWFNEANRADGEVIGDFNPSNHGDTVFRIQGRAASAADSNRYALRCNTPNNSIDLVKIVGGISETQIGGAGGTAAFTFATGTKYSYRFKIQGTTLSAKVWLSSGSEPGSYQITATDSSYTTGRWGLEQTAGSAASTSTATIENVALNDLTITYSVTPNDTANGHTAESPTVFRMFNVAPLDTVNRNTAETPAITTGTIVSPVDTVNRHASASPIVDNGVDEEPPVPQDVSRASRAVLPPAWTPAPPFDIVVYDKNFRRVGWASSYLEVEATVVHNDIDVAVFSLMAEHQVVPKLRAAGARVVIYYDDTVLMSGPVQKKEFQGPSSSAAWTFTIDSDFRQIRDMLGWPVPANPITSQGTATRYHKVTGPAETVAKTIIRANLNRFTDLPVAPTILADQERGEVITVSTRMMPLPDRFFPAIDQAGIGLKVWQDGSRLLIDCYEPVQRTRKLSEEAGTLTNVQYSETLPTVTRVVVGGPGEGTSKQYLQMINTAREAKYGIVTEQFVDATSAETVAEMQQAGAEALLAGAEQYALSLTLAESRTFRYGRTLNNGDIVPVVIPPGIEYLDVVRSTTLGHKPGEAVTVTPIVGNGSNDPNVRMARTVSALMRTSRDFKARS